MRRIVLAAALALAVPAVAQSPSLNLARSTGITGERFDGYLGFARAPSAELRREVGAVNIKRRSLYARLAQQRGVTIEEVGITAGCQLLAGVRGGEAYMLSDGAWRVLSAGAAAPVPPYCR